MGADKISLDYYSKERSVWEPEELIWRYARNLSRGVLKAMTETNLLVKDDKAPPTQRKLADLVISKPIAWVCKKNKVPILAKCSHVRYIHFLLLDTNF